MRLDLGPPPPRGPPHRPCRTIPFVWLLILQSRDRLAVLIFSPKHRQPPSIAVRLLAGLAISCAYHVRIAELWQVSDVAHAHDPPRAELQALVHH